MSEALEQIDASAERIRAELGRTTAELDRRFRAAVDVRVQLKRHSLALAGLGLTLAALVAGLAVLRALGR